MSSELKNLSKWEIHVELKTLICPQYLSQTSETSHTSYLNNELSREPKTEVIRPLFKMGPFTRYHPPISYIGPRKLKFGRQIALGLGHLWTKN